jgi:prolyl oligopeptidase PreP (S9A serine peptidase family)
MAVVNRALVEFENPRSEEDMQKMLATLQPEGSDAITLNIINGTATFTMQGGAKRKKSKAKPSNSSNSSNSTATHTNTGEKYTDKKGVTRSVYVNTRGTQMVRKKDSNGNMVYTRI